MDSEGNEIDGDYILAICGSDLAARGKLANSEIVSTVMCNLGFSIAMKEQGFEMVQTAVGDRYVLERMLADGAVIGGEQSGHIIFLEHNTTGDGLVTALQLLAVLKRTGRTLTDLAGIMKKYPQVLVNVHSDNKAGLDDCQPIWDAVAAAEKELDGRGRHSGAPERHRAAGPRDGRGRDARADPARCRRHRRGCQARTSLMVKNGCQVVNC